MSSKLKVLLIVLIGLPVATILAFGLAFANHAYPGVTVANLDLTNLSADQVAMALQQHFPQPETIDLIWGTSGFHISSETFKLKYNYADSATSAVMAHHFNQHLPLLYTLSENDLVAAIASISAQINIPEHEPEIALVDGKIQISSGENGQEVNERGLVALIHEKLSDGTSTNIAIPVNQLRPKLSDSEVESLKNRATKLLNKKLKLTSPENSWDVNSDQLITWLDPLNPTEWNQNHIEAWVAGIAQTVDRPAQNATFRFLSVGRVQEFKPALPGYTVDQKTTVSTITKALTDLETNQSTSANVTIVLFKEEPTVKTSQVNTLGIKELIGRGESDFSGSIPNRIFNLTKAASLMNGVLVAPGENFSFDKYVGDISAAGGYKQAYVIKEGRTVLGDGGGVCQVSTTLFRAVLNTGLPIVERTGHAYRVHYYENGSQAGLDATIFTPSVDFKFKNDTAAYILVQSHITGNKLIFELYGTADGRVATISKTKVWDITPPPPDLYQDDPTLPHGVIKQVDFSAWGEKTSFDYKVVRGSEILQSRTFYTNYTPWQAVFLRGV